MKQARFFLLIVLMCFNFSIALAKGDNILARHSFTIGKTISYLNYRELLNDHTNFMKNHGVMLGITGSYTYNNYVMLKIKGLLSYGYVDYEGSGSIIDVPNLLTEVRGLVGYNINLAKNSVITPYIGLGYRHLNNDSSEMLSSTGAIGYERASNYYYSPIGFIFTTKLKNKWSVSFQSEYDYFIKGLQKSNLYDINPKYSNLKNNQNKGYGIRGFLNFQKRFDSIGVKMGPFIKYWNIKKSDKQIIMQENNTITYGIEPKNDSIEAGIKIELEFLFN